MALQLPDVPLLTCYMAAGAQELAGSKSTPLPQEEAVSTASPGGLIGAPSAELKQFTITNLFYDINCR